MEGADQRLRRYGRRHFPQAQGKRRVGNGAPGRDRQAGFSNSPYRGNAGLERFRAEWAPVRVTKTRQNKSRSPVLIQSEPIRLQSATAGLQASQPTRTFLGFES